MCQDTRHIYKLRTASVVILLLLSEGLHKSRGRKVKSETLEKQPVMSKINHQWA